MRKLRARHALMVLLLALVAAAGAAACKSGAAGDAQSTQRTGSAGVIALSTATAPWPAPVNAAVAAAAAGLPALGAEQLDYHVHAHLDVVVDGHPQEVPAFIGIDLPQQLISPLHTHDTTGLIHIESATKRSFTLGQFFTEWGVRLDPSCVGGYCDAPGHPVRFYLNGAALQGDPRALEIAPHEEIAIVVGALADVPSKYDFPPGY